MTLNETTEPVPAHAVREPHKVAAVVYNPTKVDIKKLKKSAKKHAELAGWGKTLWFETDPDDFGLAAGALAIEQGADVVMAAGGDGTVRAVAQALRGSGVPLALLPQGTGNLLARNLDLTVTNLDQSLESAFGDGERTIDLGIIELTRENGDVEQHAFLVMAGLGLDAKMMANTNPKLKKAVGWLAYVDGGIRSLPEIKPIKLTYTLDGSDAKRSTAHTILIGNCGKLPGGILVMPDAVPDDGILDVVVLKPQGAFGWARVWRKIAWENGVLRKSALGRKIIDLRDDVKDVRSFRGKEMTLAVDEPQEIELDGDEFGLATYVKTWVDPGALTVKVPVEA
ncbi:diacylglycerol kinase family protein [soil metagenome]